MRAQIDELRKRAALYEELRQATDGGSESMTHEDAIEYVKTLAAENERLRDALNAAGQSLATVAMLAGRKTYGMQPIETFMATHEEVRAYAATRSAVALAALTKEATK